MASDEAFLSEVSGFLDSGLLDVHQVDLPVEEDWNTLELLPPDELESRSASGDETNSSNDDKQQGASQRVLLRERETKRRRIYRQRLKDERKTLQQEANGLTMALTTLKKNALKRKAVRAEVEQAMTQSSIPGVDMWKAVATWELESLRRAQAEQKRLHTAVTGQTQLIKDLRKVIFKRVASKALASEDLLSSLVRIESPDAALYDAYLRELDGNYSRIDKVFRTCGLESMAEGVARSTIGNEADDSMNQFLYMGKMLLPFDFQRMCECYWRVVSLEHRSQEREVYEDVKDPSNTVAMKYRVSKVLDTGVTICVQQRLVLRRFREANSMVLVWKLFADGEGVFKGMHSDEAGWCRMRPTNTSEGGSWMETHVRRSPMHYRTALRQKSDARQFSEVLQLSADEDQSKIMTGLKHLMLDES
ncbi:hypothetical protein PRNP1_012823 [Phytophthora ramorum]